MLFGLRFQELQAQALFVCIGFPAERIAEGSLNDRGAPTFVLIGPRMDAFAAYGGFGTLGGIEEIRKTLPQRPGWDLILERDGVSVIRYVPEHTKDQEASRWTP